MLYQGKDQFVANDFSFEKGFSVKFSLFERNRYPQNVSE
jgi:hypothetical protein